LNMQVSQPCQHAIFPIFNMVIISQSPDHFSKKQRIIIFEKTFFSKYSSLSTFYTAFSDFLHTSNFENIIRICSVLCTVIQYNIRSHNKTVGTVRLCGCALHSRRLMRLNNLTEGTS
jgi:hypothetical protein